MSHDRPSNPPEHLHRMQPLTRFSGRAREYAAHRPSYPSAAIAAILDGLGTPSLLKAADIGAGTGISSRLLADQGMQVWAVEPNADMRQAATNHPRVILQAGTAEKTGLENASIDLVTCFQAFHWFNPALCLPEFRRIVKPSGRLAVVWNDRDRSDPFTQGYSNIVQQVSNHHPAEQRMVAEHPLFSSAEFSHVREQIFTYQQPLDLTGLIGRAQSVSYVPQDQVSQQRLVSELTALYEQWADPTGHVYMTYMTRVFLAEPTAIAAS